MLGVAGQVVERGDGRLENEAAAGLLGYCSFPGCADEQAAAEELEERPAVELKVVELVR